jgi:CheY-like chemotaxis protein
MFELLQARQLFLAEALELCQQVKEGLLILTHAPTVQTHQKLIRRLQTLRQGAGQLGLTDIQLFGDGLASLLECVDLSAPQPLICELLHHFCDGLQLSLIAHRSIADGASVSSQRDFVLHSLMPKVLEGFETVLAQSLQASLQNQLLPQQVLWIQLWSQALGLTELKTISQATLGSFEASPRAISAIAQVAMAGFQVAYEAIIQQLAVESIPTPEVTADPQQPLCPSAQALDVFKTAQYLVGLARQTIVCVATQSIEEITLLEPSLLRQENGQNQVFWHGRTLMLLNFSDLWLPKRFQSVPPIGSEDAVMLLILNHGDRHLAVALEIDRLVVEPELKLRPPDRASMTQSSCYGIATLQGVDFQVIDLNWLLQERLSSQPPAPPTSREPWETQTIRSTELYGQLSQPSAVRPEPRTVPKTVPRTVLIVDDSRTVREILALTLQKAGYRVLQAEDGQQALEHLQRHTDIHLTICDLEMSNLSGFEFLRHRLKDPQWIQIPVIILSSHTGEEYRQLSKKLGAAEYFTIPYRSGVLLQAIEDLLNRSSG